MLDQISINLHSSIRVEGEKVLRFDPFRLADAPHDADVILITHAHYDHYSPEDVAKARKPGTILVAPCAMEDELKAEPDVVLLYPGETAQVAGIPVEAVPSYNVGKPMHPKKNGWLGYVVTVNGCRIYVAGDTDDNPDIRQVRCDVALIPIGGTYTMNAAEAAALINEIRPAVAIPTHYGSIVGKAEDAASFSALVDPEIRVVLKL